LFNTEVRQLKDECARLPIDKSQKSTRAEVAGRHERAGGSRDEFGVFKQSSAAANQSFSAESAKLNRELNTGTSSCAKKDELRSLATKIDLHLFFRWGHSLSVSASTAPPWIWRLLGIFDGGAYIPHMSSKHHLILCTISVFAPDALQFERNGADTRGAMNS
jgi:hypothetical protein